MKILTLSAMLAVPAAAAFGQTSYWSGGTNDFNNASYWSGPYIGGSNPNCSNDSGSNNVVLIQPGDPIWQHGDTLAGTGANTSGSYLQTGSTNNTGGGNWLRMAVGAGSFGSYVLSNGVVNVGGQTHIGEQGVGYLEVDGGTFNDSADPFAVGDGDWGPSPVGYMVVNGGIVNDAQELWIGEGDSGQVGTGHLTMNGGILNISSWFDIGRWGGIGYLNLNGGTINKIGGGNSQWAAYNNNVPSSATINMTGGAINFQNGVVQIAVGGNGTVGTTCVFNQSGGKVHAYDQYQIATDNNMATATNSVSGNAVLICDSWLAVGRNAGIGTLNISGNAEVIETGVVGGTALTVAGDNGSTPSVGILNQTGGTLTNTADPTWIGETGVATWNMSGGTAILGNVEMCVNASASGVLNLNGGVFQCSVIYSGSPSAVSELNLNGGTLQANVNNTNFVSGLIQATVGPGSVIDSQGYTIAIPQALQDGGNGTLTKIGAGTLTLLGANSYAGATTVSAGKLITGTSSSASASTGYTVADHAGFGVTVQSGNAQFITTSLALGVSAGASLDFNLGGFGNPASAPLNLTTLTANGTITVNVASTLISTGLIPLATFSTLVGSPTYALGSLPPGVIANLVGTSTGLWLNVTSAGLPRWNGNVTGMWDLGTNQDWVDLATFLPETYSDGKPVVFDDSATGTTTVDLTATVSPASINFNNSILPYTIVGPGKIAGTTGLTLNGTTNVSILNTGGNSFTGPVVINAGVLDVTNLANGGLPSALGASSASPTNLVIAGGTLEYNGAPVTVNRGFTIAATNSAIDAESNVTLGGPVVAGSTAGFVKIGPAQLALTAPGYNQFGNNYDPGTMVQEGTLLLNGSAGAQTNHNFNEMWIGCTTAYGGALILTNTTLNVDNWIGLGRINGGINNTSSITLYNSALTCGNLSLGWDGGLPNNLSSQFITLNGNSTFTNYGAVNLPEGANASMTFTVNGSSVFWVQNPFYICLANNTTGSLVVANSGKVVQANGWFDIGNGNNCVASVLLENNATLSLDGDCNLADTAGGANSTLTVQDNATVTANNLFVGKSSSSVCTVNIAGSATGNFGDFMRLADGSSSTGNVNISGGSLTFAQYMNMAGGSGSIASVNMSGGSLTGGNDMTVGDQGTATVTMNGGVLTIPNTLYLSRGNAVADGTVNLNTNGTIVCGNVNNGWAYNEATNSPTFNPNAFNFNGGTLKSYGSYSYIFPNVNMVVQAGGAIINDNGYTVEFGAALVNGGGGGGLTKLGSGTLRFDGTNTYAGATLVSAGTLEVAPGGSIAGPVTVASGATLAGDIGSIGTYNISNSLTLQAGSTTTISLTPSSNDQIQGLTSVSYGGALVVTNSSGSPLVVGHTYTLFSSAAAGTGNFSSVTILPAGAGTFNPATGVLTITSATAFTFSSLRAVGGNLVVVASGGTPSSGYTLLSSTNLATPISAWITNSTGSLDASGNLSNTIPLNPSQPVKFFRIRQP